MPTHSNAITVRGGNLSYSLDPIRAARGDEIAWSCNDGHFAVHFDWGGPCDKGRYRAKKGNSVRGTVRSDARGRYRYFVAVCDDNGDIWTDDPQVIIP